MNYIKNSIVFFLIAIMVNFESVSQELGLQLYSLRNEMKDDVSGTLEMIQSWGITNIEEGNGGTHGYSMQDYKTLLNKNRLKIVSVSGSYEDFRDNPEKIISKAKEYGAKYAVCFWIPHNDTIFTIKETKAAIDVFNKAGKKLKDAGITLAYHPHGYEFRPYKGSLLMDYMIENAEYFAFEMDVYWFAHPGENPLKWLREYPDKFKLMHLKDCKKGVEGNLNGSSDVETNVALGMGQINIAAIMNEAIKMQIEYLFSEDESSRATEQIPHSLKYIQSVLDK